MSSIINNIRSFRYLYYLITALLALVAHVSSISNSVLAVGVQPHYSFISPYPHPIQINKSCTPLVEQESHTIGKAAAPAWPWQIYKSAAVNPPDLDITTNGEPLAPGLLFLSPSDTSPRKVLREPAVLIMSDAGQLVWNGPAVRAADLRVASFEGDKILTYWAGESTSGANIGHGYGKVTFLDSSYNEILVVCPKLGLVTPDDTVYQCEGDLHESFVTDRDTILLTAYNATKADLSEIGGPKDGWVYDCLFFELEPRTGKVLFSWSALEHISISNTKQPLYGIGNNRSSPIDWFHINSVVNVGDQYLVNSRHLWAVYLVASSGDIIWTLQGETGGDFGALPPNGHFADSAALIKAWQHFARPHNITNDSMSISFFNNYNSGFGNDSHPSELLELKLSLPPSNSTPPAVLEHRSWASDPIYSVSQGSHTFLPNGNAFGGYGQIPVMREFGPNDPSGGDLRWSARFGPDEIVQSYRAYKQEWHGYPTTIPSLVAEFDGNGCGTGYVSWNGATDVSAWVVFEGRNEKHLQRTGRIQNKGFETKFAVSGSCVQVAAVVHGRFTRSNAFCSDP